MKNARTQIVVSILILLVGSCVRTRVVNLESSLRDPKPDNFPIDIYDSVSLSRGYKVIGTVMANAGKLHSTHNTINILKAKARNMGGDALLDLGISTSDGRLIQKLGSGYAASGLRENWAAKVIIWTENESTNPQFKIRIIKENAALKIKPIDESLSILVLPIGASFEAEDQGGDWVKIKLPPNKDGIVITGYVHKSFIEFEDKGISF